jgi:hypothetical protein
MSTRQPEGITGWQALAVIVACIAVMTATFFVAPT